jgi:hypothetical protein
MPVVSQYMSLIDFKEREREEKTKFDSFEEWMRAVPIEYLLCRDTGHVWLGDGWQGDNVEKIEQGAVMLHGNCDRCGLGRARYIGPFGEINSALNWYSYDDVPGYLYHADSFAIGKAERMKIRLELRRRSQEDAAAARRNRKAK